MDRAKIEALKKRLQDIKTPIEVRDEEGKLKHLDKSNSVDDILKECVLFVSCEPCIMCAYALNLVSNFF